MDEFRTGDISGGGYSAARHHKHSMTEAERSEGEGRIRSSLRRIFGRRKKEERASEQEWYWIPEEPAAQPPPPNWRLPTPTEESLRRAQEHGFQVAPTTPPPTPPEPSTAPSAVAESTLPEWVFSDFEQGADAQDTLQPSPQDAFTPAADVSSGPTAPVTPAPESAPLMSGSQSPFSTPGVESAYSASAPASSAVTPGPAPEGAPSAPDEGAFTILEHKTEPIGGFLEDLGVEKPQEKVAVDQPPVAADDYRYAQAPDRDTLEAVYLPAAPPEPLPGTIDAFGSVEQPAPEEPPPPPPIAVAKSSGAYEKADHESSGRSSPSSVGAAPKETRSTGKLAQKLQGPPAFAAEPDVRHVVLGFRDGTAVFIEPDHPLFSLFFQWSELVAGPETPPKAYARREAQKKIYLGKPPRGRARNPAKKKAGG